MIKWWTDGGRGGSSDPDELASSWIVRIDASVNVTLSKQKQKRNIAGF